jgi:HAD superfamily hydrolase (TIGR01490 family)
LSGEAHGRGRSEHTEGRSELSGMPVSAITAAIFDLDGTLFNGHVWLAVTRHHRSQCVNRRWLYAYVALHMPLWFFHKLHLMSGERARYVWARNMAWALRGFEQAQAGAMFAWIADEYVTPLLRPDVVERLRYHQTEGQRVMLLSGAFEGLLAVVGERLGVDEVLGTRLEQRDGRYTGRALLPVCQGWGKAERLRAYLSGAGKCIDLTASYAYADSFTDRPVLEMVGHPVAVYPDERLAALAGQQGWPVLGSVTN